MDAEREVIVLKTNLTGVKNQVRLIEERLEEVEQQLKIARNPKAPAPIPTAIIAPTPPKAIEVHKHIAAPPPLPRHIESTLETIHEVPTPRIESLPPKQVAAQINKTEVRTRTWLKDWLKSIGPEENLSWEMALGTFWLPRIGLLVTAVGVVLLATLAINKWAQEYMPYIRVAIGYGIGASLLILGRFLEKRDSSYAQLLLSGGFAFCHFVTFAAHYIEFTRIIESTAVTYALLSAIVLAWGLYAHLRRSQLMAYMVTVLAHLTVAVATLTLPEPSPASVAALIMLSLASAFFMVFNRWYMVAALGMLGSYGNQFLWFYHSPESEGLSALLMALGVVASYGVVYALAEFFADEKLRRELLPSSVRTAYVSLNSGLFIGMSLLLMQGFEFSRDKTEYLYFGYAAAALLLGIAYLKLRDHDPIFNAYFTKASVAVTLGLAATLDGAALNLSLSLEALALLVAARQTQFPLSRLLVQGAALLAIGHGLYCISDMQHFDYSSPEYARQMLPAVFSILVLLGVSLLYHRTQWQAYLPLDYVKTPALRDLLKVCDAVVVDTERDEQRAYGGQLWATLFALGASTLMVGYAYRLFDPLHLSALLGLSAVALAGAGVLLRAKPFTLASLIGSASAFVAWHLYAQNVGALSSLENGINISFVYGMIAVATFLVLSEFSRLLDKGADTWLYIPLKAAPPLGAQNTLTYLYALAGSWLFVGVVLQHTNENWYGVYFCVAAVLGTVYALFFGACALAFASILLAIVGGIFTTLTVYNDASVAYALTSMCALAVVALAGESRYVGEGIGAHYHRSKFAPYLLYGMVAWLVFACVAQYVPDERQVLSITACSIAAFGLMRVLHPRALGICATALLLSATLFWVNTTSNTPDAWWHICGVTACLVALGADRYMAKLATFKNGVPGALLVFMAWAMLQYHIDLAFGVWEYFALGMLMIAFLLYGAAFRSKTAITLSVLGAVMHSLGIITANYGGGSEIFPALMSFISLTGYWLLLERGLSIASTKGKLVDIKDSKRIIEGLCYIVCGMMLATGLCVDMLPLTIEWTIAAIIMMFLGYLFAQKYYRYAALATFALAIARAFIIDTRNLEAIYRIASMLVLGLVLLAVAYGYVQARNRQKNNVAQSGDIANK